MHQPKEPPRGYQKNNSGKITLLLSHYNSLRANLITARKVEPVTKLPCNIWDQLFKNGPSEIYGRQP